MKKISLLLMLSMAVICTNTFAEGKTGTPKAKKTMKCTMGGSCCKKTNSRVAIMKAKPIVKKA